MSEETSVPESSAAPAEASAPPEKTPEKTKAQAKRPLLARLFSISFWGAARLVIISLVVGIIQRVGWENRKESGFDAVGAIAMIWENTFKGILWIVQHGWKPTLIGATIVLPLWIIWRLVSLPFRK